MLSPAVDFRHDTPVQPGENSLRVRPGWCRCYYQTNLLSGFDRFTVVGSELQLVHVAFCELDVNAHRAEILRLDELSIGSGVAVEITHFHNLFHARKWITVGHSHGAH